MVLTLTEPGCFGNRREVTHITAVTQMGTAAQAVRRYESLPRQDLLNRFLPRMHAIGHPDPAIAIARQGQSRQGFQ